MLVDAIRAPTEFADVLINWLEKQEEWHGSRWRFFRSFEKQLHYDPDRLIGAASVRCSSVLGDPFRHDFDGGIKHRTDCESNGVSEPAPKSGAG